MGSWGVLEAGSKGSPVASAVAQASAEEQRGQGDAALPPGPGHSRWHCRHWHRRHGILDTAEALPRLHTALGTAAAEHLMPPLLG